MSASDLFTNSEDYQGTTLTIRPKTIDASKPIEPVSGSDSSHWTVFLSSTIADLKEYRQEVQDALLKRAQVACFLSEDWPNTYQSTIQKCRDEIRQARGYIGLFAYWYGFIPEGYERSITHLEFTWALEKWEAHDYPPIAILMPESLSRAEEALKKRADLLIPSDQDKQKAHAELLLSFRKHVTETGRTVRWFRTKKDLREWVIAIGVHWKVGGPLDAAKGNVEVIEKNVAVRKVTDEEWGLLGRRQQLEAFEKILNRVLLYPQVPAVAIMVHGNEDAGQKFFLKQLLAHKKLRSGRPARFGRPQVEQYGVKALMQWVGESLGVLTSGMETGSPAELADLIYEELQEQQLCFVLKQVHGLAGGIETFYQEFWRPLYARLIELCKGKENRHRLIAVVLDYADQTELPDTIAVDWKPTTTAEDYKLLLKLPVLGEITSDDLTDWFSALDVSEDIMGGRLSLVNVALTAATDGVDGTPLRVFDRLSQVELWPEGEV
jgi:hypothetical protein